MAKKAFLVWCTVGTRVIADENTPEEELFQKALPNLLINLRDNGIEVCESIFEDTECPYNLEEDC